MSGRVLFSLIVEQWVDVGAHSIATIHGFFTSLGPVNTSSNLPV